MTNLLKNEFVADSTGDSRAQRADEKKVVRESTVQGRKNRAIRAWLVIGDVTHGRSDRYTPRVYDITRALFT